jgi:hypothetical protein
MRGRQSGERWRRFQDGSYIINKMACARRTDAQPTSPLPPARGVAAVQQFFPVVIHAYTE